MDSDREAKPRVAILSGGISGLTAAKRLADAGYAVDVMEASGRLGGKIETRMLGDSIAEKGAEFVDSTHTAVRDLCGDLKVGLVAATDQATVRFRTPDGKMLSNEQFFAAAKPLQDKIIRDKAVIAQNPGGERAAHIQTLSLTDYLRELNGQPPLDGPRNLAARMKNLWTRTKNIFNRDKVPADILATYAGSYMSEGGNDAKSIDALQFVREASAKPGELLASDCAFRVEGGTEQIILALKRDLEAKGVQFHMNSKATGISKEDGQFAVELDGKPLAQKYDQVVCGLAMHQLAEIKGIEKLGFSAQDMQLLRNGQYTHNAKFSIRVNESAPDSTLFSGDGFQAWRSSPGIMTFLVGGDRLTSMKGGKLVDYCLDKYAAANGRKADELFDKRQIMFNGPSQQVPCYASPAPGQAKAFAQLSASVARMAQNGIGIVGSYLPGDGGSIGFMQDGVESANRATAVLIAQMKQRAQERAQEAALDVQKPSFQKVEDQRRQKTSAAQPGR